MHLPKDQTRLCEKQLEILVDGLLDHSQTAGRCDVARAIVPNYVAMSCESPIEEIMALAIWLKALPYEPIAYCAHVTIEEMKELKPSNLLVVCAQMHVGDYRADFGILTEADGRFEIVAVECDGHEFHEKTKEQAARDKARDRFFVESGVRVMRFTGAEIWKDACGCAKQVTDHVMGWTMDECFRGKAAGHEASVEHRA